MLPGLEAIWNDYGWLGFLVYFAYKEVWPFLRDKFLPRKIADAEAEQTRLDKKAEAELELLKQKEERDAKNEERMVRAMESMSLSGQQMALALNTNNERLSQVIGDLTEHHRFTQDTAFNNMRKNASRAARAARK